MLWASTEKLTSACPVSTLSTGSHRDLNRHGIFSRHRFKAEQFVNCINRRLSFLLKMSLAVGALLLFFQGRYQAMMEILVILLITFMPILLGKRFDVGIPHGFETMAVIFLYMSLFLGEFGDYYNRFWWWDLVLHSGSAFLLGILGFLLVYVRNEKQEINLDLPPPFHRSIRVSFRSRYRHDMGNIRILHGPGLRTQHAEKRPGRYHVGPNR